MSPNGMDSLNNRERSFLNRLYSQFLKSLAEEDVILESDAEELKVRAFLAGGVRKLSGSGKLNIPAKIRHALRQADSFGKKCALKAGEQNTRLVSLSIIKEVVDLICPFDPFC